MPQKLARLRNICEEDKSDEYVKIKEMVIMHTF